MDPYIALLRKTVIPGIIIFIGIISVIGSWTTINPGYRGVVVRLGAVQKGVLSEGFHFKLPFIDEIEKMNVQIQKDSVDADAASRDLQFVTTKIATNYNLVTEAVDEVYQKIGLAYAEKLIDPAVQEIVKAVTAKYTAEELITKRAEVKSSIKQGLYDRLIVFNIKVVDVSIADFSFSKNFNEAIEAKQVAEQQVATAKNQLERIKVEAEQRITQAKAEAESLRLQKQEISKDLIELRKIENERKAIEKWNGVLPTYTGGAMPFIQANK
ncbi:MAG: prohibitin family protein [Nitrospirae bacterium]|nr:prohibitin family protein [Nitrospirota bacterium]